MTKSFAKVALTPKWIGALLAALAIAASFAALGQWQLDRAFVKNHQATQSPAVPLEELTQPGQPFETVNKARLVNIEVKAVEILGRVANRTQKGQTGYWQIGLATLTNNTKIVIAYDFQTKDSYLPFIPVGKRQGNYLPSEEPQTHKAKLFQSLSVEQLINLSENKTGRIYSGFVALSDDIPGNAIAIDSASNTEVNALNVFYAIEWTLFAGFAVFLWWRLVQDERLGLRAER